MNQQNNKIVWDLEICKNINLLKEADKIILYGVGEKGKDTFNWIQDAGINITYFCDMDMNKWETYIEGIRVLSPFKLNKLKIEKFEVVYIIACIEYAQELCNLLEHIEIYNMRVITYWGIKMALRINAQYIYKQESKILTLLELENIVIKNKIVTETIKALKNIIIPSDDTIWIIQPGKTASSSLESRLKERNIPFIKEHFLDYPDYILGESYRTMWEMKIAEKRNSLKAILAVREPLSKDYSSFWQVFSETSRRGMLKPILQGDFQQMYNNFIDSIMNGSIYRKEKFGLITPFTWNDEFEWFDEQIKKYLDIDVFSYPFDREKGYTIIKKDNIELFIFKIEKMEKILDQISLFVGVKSLPIINVNVAKKKWYSLAYSQFRKEVRLPDRYIKHYYQGNSKMDYFYTQEEKNIFLSKWKENIDRKI